MWYITIFNVRTKKGRVIETPHPEAVDEYVDLTDADELVFVNTNSENNEH